MSCSQTVTVRDTTPPAITCAANKDINCLAPWSFDTPTATDAASGLNPTVTILSSVTNGSCNAGLTVIRTWRATDACGNSATCSQTVLGRAIVTLSGTIFAPTNYPPTLSEKRVATVALTGTTNITGSTASDGSFSCSFDAASNVVIAPMLPGLGLPADGIDALDILAVRRHILNAASLGSPYKLLAADVDGDNSISAFDLLGMRRVVLGATNRFATGLWRFVPSNYIFANQLTPWGAPANRTYSFAGNDLAGQDFVALKLGDVNYSWTPPGSSLAGSAKEKSLSGKGSPEPANATGDPVTFTVGSTNGLPGTSVLVPVRVTSFTNVAAFQFTFRWNPATVTFIDVPSDRFGLPNMSRAGTFNSANSNSGSLNVFWDDPTVAGVNVADGTAIFYVEFRIIGAPVDETSLIIDGSQTAFLVADSNIEALPATALAGQITIDQPNRPPVVDSVVNKSANEETLLAFTATVSDPDGAGQSHAFSLDPGAPAGAGIEPTTGAFTWRPTEAQGPGSYPITIRAVDNGAPPLSGTATFTVTVNEVNAAPLANGNSYIVNEDAVLTATTPGVLGNDSDPDGDALTAVLVQGPAHGALVLGANGSFTYTPVANFNGPDSFTYAANDGAANSALATVSITVNSVNDTPAANPESYSVNEDAVLTVATPGVLGNDGDIDGDALAATVASGPAHGTLALSSNGSFTYTPATNFFGADSFSYRASDALADSTPAIVSITVNPINDAPLVNADSYSVKEDATLNIVAPGVLGNDVDADGDALLATVVTLPIHGALSFSNNGSFTYTPVADYNGTDTFTYSVSDGIFMSAEVLVTLTIADTNDAPIAESDSFSMNEDNVLSVGGPGVLNNDIDPDGDTLTAILETGVAHGTLSLAGDGSFTYAPAANYYGVDSFTYRASDGQTNYMATVTITINSINDVPLANADNHAVNEDAVLTVSGAGVLGNDSDAEGDALTASVVSLPAHGALTLNGNGTFIYTPTANYHGADSFTYRASDGQTGSVAIVRLTVNALNDMPTVSDESYVTVEDTVLPVPVLNGVLVNDLDADGDVLSTVLISSTTNGTLTLNANGSFVYSPNTNFHGVDHFTYRAADGASASALAIATITVTGVNDAPLVQNDSYNVSEDATLNAATPGVLINDVDVDGNSLAVELISGTTHGALALNADGSFLYTPNPDYLGADSFMYRVTDGAVTSAVATVSITVGAVNDAPVATNNDYSTDEDVPLTIAAPGVLGDDIDLDGDTLSAVLMSGPSHGTLAFNANGSFLYTPNQNFNGTDSFTYRAQDGATNSGVATVTLLVGPMNDAPALAAIGTKIVMQGDELTFTAAANDVDLPGQTLTFMLEGALAGMNIDPVSGLFTWATTALQTSGNHLVTVRVTDNGSPSQSDSETIAIVISEYVPPTISIGDVTVPGGTDGLLEAVFEVNLSAPSARTVRVDFATADASALAGADYTATNGTLDFPPGTTNRTVEVTVQGSSTIYTNRAFFVRLSNPTNAVVEDGEGLATIDSDPVPGLYIDDVTVVEGNPGEKFNAIFTVTLLGPNTLPVSVNYAAVKDSALTGKDFKAKKGKLKFAPGVSTQTIIVPITGESLSESNEVFHMELSKPVNAVIVDGQGIGTIIDNDPLPAISVADVATVEANDGVRAVSFLVRLSAKSGQAISVDFSTEDGSAVAGSDYFAVSGPVLFPPGTLLQKVIVGATGNIISESNEIFFVNLSHPVNAVLGDAQAIATIRDNDTAPVISVSDATVVIDGLGANAVFTLQLSAPSEKPVTATFSTAPNTALAGVDYTSVVNGSVIFAAGQTSRSVSIALLNNPAATGSRNFSLSLQIAENAKLGDRIGVCNIPAP
ncbi:MAG TPA: Ig-like domain-containing protein [Candidatus Limnocylindria bacterium]|nr:Ig-like domain-containing protein [Candidatus Limnocylindria bacterium]